MHDIWFPEPLQLEGGVCRLQIRFQSPQQCVLPRDKAMNVKNIT